MPAMPALFARFLLPLFILMPVISAQAVQEKTPPVTTAETLSSSDTDNNQSNASDADTSETLFLRKHQAIVSTIVGAIRGKNWKAAINPARELFDFAIQHNGVSEQMDAGLLLVKLLHQQHQYNEAVQVIDKMVNLARLAPQDPQPEQMNGLVQRGMQEAMMADDSSALKRYQHMLYKGIHLYSGLWQWSGDKQQLRYLPAQMTFSASKGRWILTNVKDSDQRSKPMSVKYLYVTQSGDALEAEISVSYDAQQGSQTPQEKLSGLQEHQAAVHSFSGIPDAELTRDMPALPYTDAVQVRYATREKLSQGDLLTMYWDAIRGNWHLTIKVQFWAADEADVRAQLPVLLNEMVSWPEPTSLPGNVDFAQQYESLSYMGLEQGRWSEAAKTAATALSNALFPREIAYLQSIIGIAAYQTGDVKKAGQALDLAFAAWPAVRQSGRDESLYQRSLEYTAEIAAQSGNDDKAMTLTRQYVESTGHTYFHWALHQNELENHQSKLRLPLRVAGFHIQPVDENRFYYQDLKTGQTVGLTTGLPIPTTDDEQEQLLVQVLDKQFRLQVTESRGESYPPDPLQPRKGMQWVFDVEPQMSDVANTNPETPPVKRVIFWVIDQNATRTILRASVNNKTEEERAMALVDALTW